MDIMYNWSIRLRTATESISITIEAKPITVTAPQIFLTSFLANITKKIIKRTLKNVNEVPVSLNNFSLLIIAQIIRGIK